MCPRCGNLRSECEDPAVDWHPRTAVCWASGTQEWGKRRMQQAYSDWKPPTSDPYAMHPLDGHWVYVSRTAPDVADDEFLGL